jgi:DNA-binding winged helix-turn-helix (wHTH) protein/tetratricopeptide (TPR) repeat protein
MSDTVGFLDYALDAANAQLRRGGQVVPLRLKAFTLLQYLAERPGRLVTKADLLDAVWPDTAVSEWVLTTTVRELRDALGDDARQPRVIETVHGRGYRFIASISPEPALSSVEGSSVLSPESLLSTQHSGLPTRYSGLRTQDSALRTILVGRHAELETLARWWQRAQAGERQIVFVIGEAGMGKTALTDEFLRLLGVRENDPNTVTPNTLTPCLIARGQCIEQRGAGEPYLPVLEALGRLCLQPGGARLVELLRRHAPAWLVQLPGLLEPAECEALERRLGATTRERMLREMAALVAALPAPLVLVLEDLHWSDHATLDLLSTLAQRRDPARLLLIGTYRPVDVTVRNHPLRGMHQDLRAHTQCQDLWLTPLTETAVEEYLHARWPRLAGADTLARLLQERTDGNPLFLINIVDYLAVGGAITEVDGEWKLEGDPETLAAAVPPGLRQLIAAHVERLDDMERAALEAGSLVGRRFSAALVAAALDADVVAAEERLARLAHNGLMVCADGASEWPDGTVAGTYRFNHFQYQSVLRDRIPPARQHQLHQRFATRLERAFAGHLAEVSSELALHFEASGEADLAAVHLEEAALRAVRRGANREAVTLLEHGLALIDPLPRTPERTLRTIRLCLVLGPSMSPARGLADGRIEHLYERARRLSEESNDPVQLFQALIALSGAYTAQARLDRAQETARQLEQLLAALPLPPLVFSGSLVIGMVKYHAGSLAEARQLLERAVSLGDVPLPPTTPDLHVGVLSYLTLALLHQGYTDQARARLEQAASRAAELERPFDRAVVAQVACFVHLILHDMAGLAGAADQAAALDDFPAIATVGRLSRGRVLSAGGDHGRGIVVMREAIDAYRAIGLRIALPAMLAALAEGHAAAGETAAALACVADARATAESTGEIRYLAELHRLEGALHAAGNDRSAAERCFRDAVGMAREQGERLWELRATTSWARPALQPGTRAAVRRTHRDRLSPLIASFSEGSDTADLQEARQILASLE